jgi:magnesium-transporting ATPase (P-type)
MVTGDNIDTAIAIAKDAKIIPPDFHRPKSADEKNFYVVM